MNFRPIGQNIQKIRVEKRLRQEEVAEKVGISPVYYSALERGVKCPSLYTFIAILNALEVSADKVLCDVVTAGYTVKHSMITEKIDGLSKKDAAMVYDVIDTLVKHTKR